MEMLKNVLWAIGDDIRIIAKVLKPLARWKFEVLGIIGLLPLFGRIFDMNQIPEPMWYAVVIGILLAVWFVVCYFEAWGELGWDLTFLGFKIVPIFVWAYWLGAAAKYWLHAPNWLHYAILALPVYVLVWHMGKAYCNHINKKMDELRKS